VDRKHPLQLVVEGEDDFHFVLHLAEASGLGWDDEPRRPWIGTGAELRRRLQAGAKGAGGDDAFAIQQVSELLAAGSPYQRTGLVLDANGDPASRWAEIGGLLGSTDIGSPARRGFRD